MRIKLTSIRSVCLAGVAANALFVSTVVAGEGLGSNGGVPVAVFPQSATKAERSGMSKSRDMGPSGGFKVLYSFTGATGSVPHGGLVADSAGNLYGTTIDGGAYGFGTVFELTPAGVQTVLYQFTGGSDGGWPQAGLTSAGSNGVYGTTLVGGAYNEGSVFRIASDGTQSVVHSFVGGADGASPYAALIQDGAGNFYGTTCRGGAEGNGSIFEITADGAETVLRSFSGGPQDGACPVAALLMDASANLYGTSLSGGVDDEGTVFELSAKGGYEKEAVLYAFTGGSDGAEPQGALIQDSAGNLYGTAYAGGMRGGCANNKGCGVVFVLAPDGKEQPLYSFTGGSDGAGPDAGLFADTAGNLYGTATVVGDDGCNWNNRCGVVFLLAPNGIEATLHTFSGGDDGGNPFGGLIADRSGNLYGTTSIGGAHRLGTVFELRE